MQVLSKEKLQGLKPGDVVERLLGGIPILHRVKEVNENIIILVPNQSQEEVDRNCLKAAERIGFPIESVPLGLMPEWTFNKKTGLEIDKELGWDGLTKTGSAIIRIVED